MVARLPYADGNNPPESVNAHAMHKYAAPIVATSAARLALSTGLELQRQAALLDPEHRRGFVSRRRMRRAGRWLTLLLVLGLTLLALRYAPLPEVFERVIGSR